MTTIASTPIRSPAAPVAQVWYTVEKNRFYREGEHYSSGSGFEGSTPDREQAENWFAAFSHPHGDEVFSLELRTGQEIIKRSGPSKDDATRSMMRAYRESRPAAPRAAARHCRTCTRSAE